MRDLFSKNNKNKNYLGDNDVSVARDRLKGALQEILHHSDSASSGESSEETSSQDYKPSYRRM